MVETNLCKTNIFANDFGHLWPSDVAMEVGAFGNAWMSIDLHPTFRLFSNRYWMGMDLVLLIQYTV